MQINLLIAHLWQHILAVSWDVVSLISTIIEHDALVPKLVTSFEFNLCENTA